MHPREATDRNDSPRSSPRGHVADHQMTLDEIRSIVADTTAADWRVLSGDAPTYLNRFAEVRGTDEHWLQHSEHEARRFCAVTAISDWRGGCKTAQTQEHHPSQTGPRTHSLAVPPR